MWVRAAHNLAGSGKVPEGLYRNGIQLCLTLNPGPYTDRRMGAPKGGRLQTFGWRITIKPSGAGNPRAPETRNTKLEARNPKFKARHSESETRD